MRVVGSVTKSVPMRDRTCAPYARMPLAVALLGLIELSSPYERTLRASIAYYGKCWVAGHYTGGTLYDVGRGTIADNAVGGGLRLFRLTTEKFIY